MTIRTDARICAANFARYFNPIRSSAIPTRYSMMTAQAIKHKPVRLP